ncbi:MAG: hypothetical protein AAF750_08000 [Planctomycetota bacterium]
MERSLAGFTGRELPCRACEYDLQGLPVEGECPECGLPIGVSLRTPLLRYSDAEWVRGLASGAGWILGAVAVGFGFGFVIGVAGGGGGPGMPGASPGALLMQGVLEVVTQGMYLLGVWRLTAPEPGGFEGEDRRARVMTRRSAVVALVIDTVVFVWLIATGAYSGSGSTVGVAPIALAEVVSGIAGLVVFFGLFVYARWLAFRLPDRRLAGSTRVVMWGIVVSFGLLLMTVVMVALTGMGGGAPAQGSLMLAGLGGCAGAIAIVVFSIWSLVLVVKYRRRFLAAAMQAEREGMG